MTRTEIGPPGPLTTPHRVLKDDPRVDPRLVGALAQFGMGLGAVPLPVDAGSPIADILAYMAESEAGSDLLNDTQLAHLAPVKGVTSTVETIPGVDGNEITLYLHRPASARPVPGILHLHGGGMVKSEAASAVYTRWREELAAAGMVVVGVEFRNAAGKHGPHPFPAGLNDCSSALDWMHAHREELGVSAVVVSGDSGGANLSLAVAIKANREGRTSRIDGVYAMCPYISGVYAQKPPEFPSLYEYDGLSVSCASMGVMVRAYDPSGENSTNPLAWPFYADRSDLEGLPPHVISVNELDPLRDEGLGFYRKLLAADVSAMSRTVNGTVHAAENLFFGGITDVSRSTIRDIEGFARSLVT